MILTISRQAATNGELIARRLAEHLGCPVYDRELVEEVARRLHRAPHEVAHFDETALTVVDSLIAEWRSALNADVYARYLRQALEQIAQQACAVIIGRGANFVLHGPHVLNVRIVAPLALRVAIYRETHPVPAEEARRTLRQLDRERAQFIRTLYRQSIDEAIHYDLVVNLGGWPPEEACTLLLQAATLRAAADVPPEVHATLPAHLALMTRHRRRLTPEMVERERGRGQ